MGYLEQWKESIDGRPGKFSSDDRAKMFIAWQIYEGIILTVHSSIELTRFLLNNDIDKIFVIIIMIVKEHWMVVRIIQR